ncbi:FadR/GntR family transcriptional regulator [Pedobacter frigiditerrae]|uniref:FadR/GntR family transcriptional regulator n=1 Tax=Pedobacter frigiditerrae TaxID=2530452 RepID=UPI00292CD119|nr:GntR family transcriptional regulator [Pedobacter frigiditerrae]
MALVNDLSTHISKIPTDTMADIVELKLRDYFKKKSFVPGDALPKEQELAEALGVSRNVLREALSRLRMLGIIETKKKRGMILSSPDVLGGFERVMDPLIISPDALQDLFELRLILEMGLAEVLFLNLNEKSILELEKIVANEKKNNKELFRIVNEVAFHGKLYEMAGNDTLKRFQNMLLPVFGYVLQNEKENEYKSGAVTHQDLVNILKSGNKEEFKKGMYEHLKPHFERLQDIKKNG